jgi:hypothetical protein
MFLVDIQPLHPETKCQPLFCISSKTGNGSDVQGFNQIATKIKMQIIASVLLFDRDPSYNSCHGDFFIWWVDSYHQNKRNLSEPLNKMRCVHKTVPMGDPLHLTKKFCSRLLKYVLTIPTTNGVRSVNLILMKSVLGMTPALTDAFQLVKMRDIYPLSIVHVQRIVTLLHNGMIVGAVALLLMTLFLTGFRPESVALNARMDMLQMSFFLVLFMLQEYKVLADQRQGPPATRDANDGVTL